jgi:cell division septation protein DedD
MRPRILPALTVALGLLVVPLPGVTSSVAAQSPGQTSPALDTVEAQIAEGRFLEAREGLERWWEGEPGASRPERQQALWLRARLTVDPAMAELDFRRLVVEYPGGPWSDAALLRLAQGAEFRGDEEAARQYLGILARDYPQSPHRVEARERLARLEAGAFPPAVGAGSADGASPVAEPTPRVEAPSAGPPAAGEPAEESRTPPIQEAPVREAPVEEPPPAPMEEVPPPEAPAGDPATGERATGEEGPEEAGPFTVQLGAFSTEDGARSHAAELRAAGLQVRVVQVDGSPLFRVRTGGFHSRDEAERAARVPQGMGYPVLVATDRDRERLVGG